MALTAPLPPLPGVVEVVESDEDPPPLLEESVEEDPSAEVVPEDELDESELDEPLFVPPLAPPAEVVQVFTWRTAGLPLSSVMGVRVITQVWVVEPDAVVVVCWVIRVVVPSLFSCLWTTTGTAYAMWRRKRSARVRNANMATRLRRAV